MFTKQIEQTRHEFDEDRRNPPLRENEPEFAGAALWARSLAKMVQQNWELLRSSQFLLHTREADDAETAFHALMTVLNDYKLNRYQAWVERINAMDPQNLLRRLETPLMRRAALQDEQASLTPIKAGQLICNFDRDLTALFIEVGPHPFNVGQAPSLINILYLIICRWCTGRSFMERLPSPMLLTTFAIREKSSE